MALIVFFRGINVGGVDLPEHARLSRWIAADTVRIKDGILLEHWDIRQVAHNCLGIEPWKA
jgi:hypothetical protein